jgi:hypothetical protein
MTLLLDTCILIDILRQRAAAIEFIEALTQQPHISVVTIAELRTGQRSLTEAKRIDQLIGGSIAHPVTSEIAETAGGFLRRFRKSHGLDIADAFIAATAHHLMLPLATLNLKHFPMFPHLEAPY